jgi:hypothetical protein
MLLCAYTLPLFLLSLTAPAPGVAAGGGEPPAIVVVAAPDTGASPERIARARAAMERALAGRCPPGASIQVTLTRLGIEIRVGTLRRAVPIPPGQPGGDGDSDDAALRMAALHAIDLVQPPPPATHVTPAPEPDLRAPVAAAPPAPERPRWSVAAAATIAAGVAKTDPRTDGAVVGIDRSRRRIRIGVDGAWDRAPQSRPGTPSVAAYDAWSLRARATAAIGPAELGLRAGGIVYRIEALHAFTTTTPVIGLLAGLRLPIAGRACLLLQAGADLFSRPSTVSIGSTVFYSTPRLAPFAAVGVAAQVIP